MLIPDYLNIRTESLTQIAKWSLFTCMLSLFIEFCMREKKIFGFWLEWLSSLWMKNHPNLLREEMKASGILPQGYDSLREWCFDNTDWFFFRLNRCVVCFNIWISLFFCLFTGLNFTEIVFYILLSNLLVRFLFEKIV